MEKRSILCKECGTTIETTDELEGLNFKWLGDMWGPTSETSCPDCGTRTIQKAWRTDWTGGEFLIIKTHNRIRKG